MPQLLVETIICIFWHIFFTKIINVFKITTLKVHLAGKILCWAPKAKNILMDSILVVVEYKTNPFFSDLITDSGCCNSFICNVDTWWQCASMCWHYVAPGPHCHSLRGIEPGSWTELESSETEEDKPLQLINYPCGPCASQITTLTKVNFALFCSHSRIRGSCFSRRRHQDFSVVVKLSQTDF